MKTFKQFANEKLGIEEAEVVEISVEEFETLDEETKELFELNKSTLASYIKKASRSVGAKRSIATSFEKDADSAPAHKRKDLDKASAEFNSDARKRLANIGKAADRLANEEVEQIDELNSKTLTSYVTAAKKDAARHRNASDIAARMDKERQEFTPDNKSDAYKKMSDAHAERANKRTAGIKNALTRLKLKEELCPKMLAKVEYLMGDTQSRNQAVAKVAKHLKMSDTEAEKHVDHVINKAMSEASNREHPLMQQYRKNEDENAHSENIVLLADNFGDDSHKLMAKAALAHRDKHGGFSSDNKVAMNHVENQIAIHNALYPELSKVNREYKR